MKFANINFIQPLLSEEISPDTEITMKELVEKYRPVRQRTVRGETIKDKTGALLPAVYSKEQDCNRVDLMEGLGNDLNTGEPRVLPKMKKKKKTYSFMLHPMVEMRHKSHLWTTV